MADKVVLDGELSPVLPFDGDFSLDIPLAGELGIVTQTGGGGAPAVLVEKSVSANGVYNASADSADGYSKVTVNVPASAVDTGTKSISITENGTTSEDVTGYASASITVNVPNTYTSSDEGKVVDGGALVGQTSLSVTENDTYDTTTVNEVTVNVSGGGATLPLLITNEDITILEDMTTTSTGNTQIFANAYLPGIAGAPYPTILILIENTFTGQYDAEAAIRFSAVRNLDYTERRFVRNAGIISNVASNYAFYIGAGSVIHRYIFVRAES